MGVSGMFLASETAPVSAVAVTARVESTVNVNCDSQPSVRVSFAWTGGRQVEDYYNAPCDRTYRKGEAIRAFVASNDPSNVAPGADWILSPDEHDPFTPFGPNAVGPMLVALGAVTTVAGVVTAFWSLRLRRQSVSTDAH